MTIALTADPFGAHNHLGATDGPLDTTVRLVTPERIEFRHHLAGPARRSLAYLLDTLFIGILLFVVLMVVVLLSWGVPSLAGPYLVFYFVVFWGYGPITEGLLGGRTLGKWACGLRVVTIEGVPISGSQAVIRNLVGLLDGFVPVIFFLEMVRDFIPVFYLPGLTCMILTRRFQRLGDLAAGTMVVVEEPRITARMPQVGSPALANLLPFLPLRIAVSSDQARALSDYARTRARFNRDRREEIARHLAEPLRHRYGLPMEAPGDLVLCAVYYRVFLGE